MDQNVEVVYLLLEVKADYWSWVVPIALEAKEDKEDRIEFHFPKRKKVHACYSFYPDVCKELLGETAFLS